MEVLSCSHLMAISSSEVLSKGVDKIVNVEAILEASICIFTSGANELRRTLAEKKDLKKSALDYLSFIISLSLTCSHFLNRRSSFL